MLIEYIERLRKEPKEVRQQAVVFWTVVSVAVILALYITLRIVLAVADDAGTSASQNIAAPYGEQ